MRFKQYVGSGWAATGNDVYLEISTACTATKGDP